MMHVNPSLWNDSVYRVPAYERVPEWDSGRIQAVFYEGLPFCGKSTKVFAYYGVPEMETGEPLPAVVLLHGGAGTAYVKWIQRWNERGYAAIAMDLEGHVPKKNESGQWTSHEWRGPELQGVFDDISLSVDEQWVYHAIANARRAYALIRSLVRVDSNKIGLVGISWGAIIACLVAGLDSRFAFAIPVYGCGYLYESLGSIGSAFGDGNKTFWDPSHTIKRAKLPMLWVNSDDDRYFSIDVFAKSYRLAKSVSTLTIRPDMEHSHSHGWAPEEIYVFADSMVKGGVSLAKVTGQGCRRERENEHIWVEFSSEIPIAKVELIYSITGIQFLREGRWEFTGEWIVKTIAANPGRGGTLHAEVPEGTKLCYINLTDTRNCVVSSDLFEWDECRAGAEG